MNYDYVLEYISDRLELDQTPGQELLVSVNEKCHTCHFEIPLQFDIFSQTEGDPIRLLKDGRPSYNVMIPSPDGEENWKMVLSPLNLR